MDESHSAASDLPISFGYKCGWFAIPSCDESSIFRAFGLGHPQPSGWQNGIVRAYEDKVFVTPSLGGWRLLLSWKWLSFLDRDPAHEVGPALRALSRHINEVQFFVTYRVPEYHLWAQAVSGKIQRAYCWIGEIGEIVWEEGQPTQAELQVGTFDENVWPNEQSVMEIASHWSINPSDLEQTFKLPSAGILCDSPHSLPQ